MISINKKIEKYMKYSVALVRRFHRCIFFVGRSCEMMIWLRRQLKGALGRIRLSGWPIRRASSSVAISPKGPTEIFLNLESQADHKPTTSE